MNRHLRTVLAPAAAVALALSAAACDDDGTGSGDVTVTEAWVRQPAEGQTTSAAYGVITNDGDETVTLVGGAVEFDATVEVHETMMDDDGVMMMQEREDGFEIAAGDSFTLEPGGPHVMMLDIDPAEIVDPVAMTFVFDDGTEVTVDAEVREIGDMDGMDDMDDMDSDG
ncbi:MAG TPA: copper chaperone PCu(A)C [Ilumatobacteraceae bacterium]|nr:copper chaperone PCu(A)C [Ilumatobacteraceae bacterium]